MKEKIKTKIVAHVLIILFVNIYQIFHPITLPKHMLINNQSIFCIELLFNAFTTEGFSITRPFMHLSKHVFQTITSAMKQYVQKWAMRLIFVSKYSKFNVHSKNAIKNLRNFLLSPIIVFELIAVNYPNYYENTRSS